MEILPSNMKNKKLFNDNDAGRMQFENCMQKGKRVVNPIINWSTPDVWEYLITKEVPYCKLYDEGFDRIGCLGCPMGGGKGMQNDFERYPYVKELYLNAYEKMLEYMWSLGKETTWKTGEDVLEWQMWASDKEQQAYIDGQIDMFGDDEDF